MAHIDTTSRGKTLKVNLKVQTDDLLRLVKTERDFRLDVLWQIGRYGRRLLQARFLSRKSPGTVKAKGFAKTGNGYKVRTYVNDRINKIKFTSFILNLFEHGRSYKEVGVPGKGKPSPLRVKAGKSPYTPFARKAIKTDPARKILTSKFRAALNYRIQDYAEVAIIHSLEKLSGIRV